MPELLWVAGAALALLVLTGLALAVLVGSKVEHALRDWWK